VRGAGAAFDHPSRPCRRRTLGKAEKHGYFSHLHVVWRAPGRLGSPWAPSALTYWHGTVNPLLPKPFQNIALIHAGNSPAQPDVYRATCEGRDVLVKTYRTKPLFVRLLFGRRNLRHENDVLSLLQDLPHVPRLYDMPDRDTLLMEFVAGHGYVPDGRDSDVTALPPVAFFEELKGLLQTIHQRGISHGDMRRRNVLWADDGRPVLIDFGLSLSCNGRLSFLRRAVFKLCRRADLFAVVKMQESCCPGSLTAEEERLLTEIPWHLRVGRFLKQRIYRRFLKQRVWRRRLERLRRGSTTTKSC